jgi:hypothetical protein
MAHQRQRTESEQADAAFQSAQTGESGAPFVARCSDCGFEAAATDPNDVLAAYRRHARHTRHTVTWRRADLGVDADLPSEPSVTHAVAALEPHYDAGVPVGALTAALGAHGYTIGQALDALYAVRIEGSVYEPRDDHLKTI